MIMLPTGDETRCCFCACSWLWESSHPQIKIKKHFQIIFLHVRREFPADWWSYDRLLGHNIQY